MRIPKTIWVAWCRTCGEWLDETESAKSSAELAINEHYDHFNAIECRVDVIPFRRDLAKACRVRAKP